MHPRAARPLSSVGAVMSVACLGGLALALTACGGSSTTATGPAIITPIITNYSVSGSVSGLTAGSVVLANGAATVTVAANTAAWTFPTTFAPGTSYSVTVQTQPATELCAVTGGATGTNTGNVGNVTVVCSYGQWAWQSGLSTAGASGVYGTAGTAAVGNRPGGRDASGAWTDASGNFWLFGGVGDDATGTAGYLNDLWQFSPTTKQWTWINGGSGHNASGSYGTQSTAAAGNEPGARYSANTWIDSSGNLWLFGGVGYGSASTAGNLNDLWRYSPSNSQWTWVGGSSSTNSAGSYGTQGSAAAGNEPGARYSAASWIDSSGNLWLFGGYGYGSTSTAGNLNDLWRYSPSNSQWTWVGGSSSTNGAGSYGTQGSAAAGNEPGARYSASTWIDSSGNLWLFGGYGYDSTGSLGKLNDLWKYVPGSGQWTWISGEDAANASGAYSTLGVVAAGFLPGARQSASAWTDGSGNLWLFGGVGYDASGAVGNLNDLWKYSASSNEWTWVSGGYGHNAIGVYGALGTGSPGTLPGGRNSSSTWVDSSGSLWLFGGDGSDSTGIAGYLDDLWRYTPGT